MDPLAQFLNQEIYRGFLVFIRVGAALSFLPGFGEHAVPVRARLFVCIATALALTPGIEGLPASIPGQADELLRQFAGEMIVGAFIGLGAKLFVSALLLAGSLAGQAIGLGNPFAMQGVGMEGGSVLSGTLVIAGTAAVFVTDLHYLMLDAIARSYAVWPAAQIPDLGALAGRYSQLVAATFRLGVGMASPFLVFGIVMNVALGLVNRVMPAMPVYFVGTPGMLYIGLMVFAATAGAMVTAYLAALSGWLAGS
jgi:flagellar biosynthetic protein FliR